MGKLNATLLRYLNYEDIGVLAGVELGMKNHELVAAPLVTSLSNLQYGGVHKILRELCKHRLLSYERGRKYDGYRLTNLGYDYLALHELTRRKTIASFGNQIGVGKESNIYIVANEEGEELCLKLHRLGRVCFRKVAEKRDYHKHAKALSWLYLSKISATKEFSYMTALFEEGFPVPRPISFNRHCVIMELVKGDLLNHITELKHPENLYDQLMDIIVRFASSGLIHGDFNEFNIMITEGENPIIIDFPQMISIDHVDAEMYFNRDVECIKTFFKKRFGYESQLYPKLSEIERSASLDAQIQCTGFRRELVRGLNKVEGLENEQSTKSESVKNDQVEHAIIDVNNIGIEKWLSNVCSKDSHEQVLSEIESDSDSDDCSIDEWISQNLFVDSVEQTDSKNIESDSGYSKPQHKINKKGEDSLFSDSSDYEDTCSVISTATITQENIKRVNRKKLQRLKIKEARRRCLVKGEASAVTRTRRQNVDHIKQTKILFGL